MALPTHFGFGGAAVRGLQVGEPDRVPTAADLGNDRPTRWPLDQRDALDSRRQRGPQLAVGIHAIAADLRRRSQQAVAGKTEELMDANSEAIAAVLRHHECTLLIHGHTHRPAHHALEVDAVACDRWVIADWRDRACWLEADDHDLRAFTTAGDGRIVPDARFA